MKKILIQFSKSLIPTSELKSIKGGYGDDDGPKSCGFCFTPQGTMGCRASGEACICPHLGGSPCS